jgi:superfamily II DNA or RNA helicase
MITKGARTQMGDFKISDLEDLNDAEIVAGDVVECYQERANGKTCIAFAISIEHSIAIESAYLKAGIPALHLDATTDRDTHRQALDRLKSGELKVITNVGLFGEGVGRARARCGADSPPHQIARAASSDVGASVESG